MSELFDFEKYEIGLMVIGLLTLTTTWIPQHFFKRYVTLPLIHIAVGFILFSFIDFKAVSPFIEDNRWMWEKITELAVIISLLGAGLKIDKELTWKNWKVTFMLLAVTMPLTIIAISFLGWWLGGLSLASAVLLGAVLAPTDPVLAADVQVKPPHESPHDNHVRFPLTSEAGLNDGLAFPFTYFAVGLAMYGFGDTSWIGGWVLQEILYKTIVGCGIGYAIGHILSRVIFDYPTQKPIAREGLGFIAVSILFTSYGGAELLGGYGFLAVFISAMRIKKAVNKHDYHLTLYDFSENIERLVMSLILFLLGGLATVLVDALTWESFALMALAIFIIRPIAGWLGQIGCHRSKNERAVVAFFGIRGIGSIYYLAYAMGKADFAQMNWIWATVVLIIVCSATIHGFSALPVMRWLDKQKK